MSLKADYIEVVLLLDQLQSRELELMALGVLDVVSGVFDLFMNVVKFFHLLFNSRIELDLALSCVLQSLLQISDLSGQFSHGSLVLGILLLDLRQVFHLNGFSLEYCSLHVFDHRLLLLPQLLEP